MITVENIHNATLKRSLFGGYSISEVDDLLDQIEEQMGNDQKTYAGMEEKLTAMKAVNQEKEARLQALQEELDGLAGLKEDNREKDEQLKVLRCELDSLSSVKTADRERDEQLQGLREENDSLHSQLARLKAQLDSIQAENDELKAQLAAAKAEPAQTEQPVQTMPTDSEISNAILKIHRVSEEILKEARAEADGMRARAEKEAESVREKARLQSEDMVSQAITRCNGINAEYNRIRTDMTDFCGNVQKMFQEKLAMLSDMPEYCRLPEAVDTIVADSPAQTESAVGPEQAETSESQPVPEARTTSRRFAFLQKN